MKKTEEYNQKTENFRQKLSFFIMGLINNLIYVVVLSASDSLAKSLNSSKYMSLFSASLVLFSAIVRIINSRYLIKILHRKKIASAMYINMTGLLIMILSIFFENFFFCLIGSTLLGIGCALGDSTLQGFIKGFDPKIISGYSSGTGFAGVSGAFYYLIMFSAGVRNEITLGILTFGCVAYYFFFLWVLKLKMKLDAFRKDIGKEDPLLDDITDEDFKDFKDVGVLEEEEVEMENKETDINEVLTFTNFPTIFKKIRYYSLNLGLVYFLEYSCITYLASLASDNFKNDKDFLKKESFQILQILYQIGVFISRSSLEIFQIENIHYFTFLQFFMYIIWVIIACSNLTNIWLMFFVMFLVGLIAGSSYVNCLYSILKDEKIKKSEMEVSTTLNSMFIDSFIFLSGLVGIVFKYTFNK